MTDTLPPPSRSQRMPSLYFTARRFYVLAKQELSKPCILMLIILQIVVCVSMYELYNHHLIFVKVDPNDSAQEHRKLHIKKKLYIDWAHIDSLSDQGMLINWENIELAPQPAGGKFDNWIVLTTIHKPTKALDKLAALKDWKVVVIGDENTPKDWSFSNFIYLDVEKQKSLGYEITDHIPTNHYSRKNIGYLYAIQHGAKQIYDADNYNHLINDGLGFRAASVGRQMLVYDTNSTIINPLEHFGHSTIWPRGYPLEMIGSPPQHTFLSCNKVRPLIQQAVSNGDADVDAVFKLTRKDHHSKLDIEFDSSAAEVALPARSFSPFNSQNTLFQRNAFWGMLLPVSCKSKVSDVLRSYWAQRLLWQLGGHLVFCPPNSYRVQPVEGDLLQTLKDEQAIYYNTGHYLAFLKSWNSKKTNIFDQALELGIALYKEKFWYIRDAHLLEAWLHDLIRVGYTPPFVAGDSMSSCQAASSKKIINQLPKEQPPPMIKLKNRFKKLFATDSKSKKRE